MGLGGSGTAALHPRVWACYGLSAPNRGGIDLNAKDLFSVAGKGRARHRRLARHRPDDRARLRRERRQGLHLVAQGSETCDEAAAELSQRRHLHRRSRPTSRPRPACESPGRTSSPRASRRSHILVNNAGANWGAPLAEYPDSAWDKVLGAERQGRLPPDARLRAAAREGGASRAIRRASSTSARSTASTCRSSRPTPTPRARPPCTT